MAVLLFILAVLLSIVGVFAAVVGSIVYIEKYVKGGIEVVGTMLWAGTGVFMASTSFFTVLLVLLGQRLFS